MIRLYFTMEKPLLKILAINMLLFTPIVPKVTYLFIELEELILMRLLSVKKNSVLISQFSSLKLLKRLNSNQILLLS